MSISGVVYHYVRPIEESKLRYLGLPDFEQQLTYLEQNVGPIITRNQWEDAKRGHPVSGVLLTFDDGLKDHYKYVLPVLVKHNYFAIFFICSDPLIKGSSLPVHIIHHLTSLDQNEKLIEFFKSNLPLGIFDYLTKEPALSAHIGKKGPETEVLVKKLINYCNNSIEIAPIVNMALETFSDIPLREFSEIWYMNEVELREIVEYNMVVGSHTCSHTLLTSLDEIRIFNELNESKFYLEKIIGSEITEFCYPFGGIKSYDKKVIDLVNKVNYKFAHIVEPRPMNQLDFSSKFTLPRFDCRLFPFGTAHSLKSITKSGF